MITRAATVGRRVGAERVLAVVFLAVAAVDGVLATLEAVVWPVAVAVVVTAWALWLERHTACRTGGDTRAFIAAVERHR